MFAQYIQGSPQKSNPLGGPQKSNPPKNAPTKGIYKKQNLEELFSEITQKKSVSAIGIRSVLTVPAQLRRIVCLYFRV